jgi:hypothetical protein
MYDIVQGWFSLLNGLNQSFSTPQPGTIQPTIAPGYISPSVSDNLSAQIRCKFLVLSIKDDNSLIQRAQQDIAGTDPFNHVAKAAAYQPRVQGWTQDMVNCKQELLNIKAAYSGAFTW